MTANHDHGNDAESRGDDDLSSLCKELDLIGSIDSSSTGIDISSKDFGGIYSVKPLAFIRPTNAEDVARVVRAAVKSSKLTVAARGNGHSVDGQAMADGGLVLDMLALKEDFKFVLINDHPYVDVSGGALWEDVLRWSVTKFGLAPRSFTDYLALTVGGTLSVGGVGGQTFRYGPLASNVTSLNVVTGKGELLVCSETENPELFWGALGGLGQFGIITRARIVLQQAPDMVKKVRMVYSEFEDFTRDAELLVSRPEGECFDYLEGLVILNSDNQKDGWPSIPLSSDQVFDPARIPAAAGPVLYCLDVALNYGNTDQPSDIDKKVEGMVEGLRFLEGLKFEVHKNYMEFMLTVKRKEEMNKASGVWHAPHPWLNLFIAKDNIMEFDAGVFKKILKHGVGGPLLVYPVLRSKWDSRTSLPLVESEIFYVVAMLRLTAAPPDGPSVEEMLAENREVVEFCNARDFDFKIYLIRHNSQEDWKRYFGNRWSKFVERKALFDPMNILAPGQNIFSRSPPIPN